MVRPLPALMAINAPSMPIPSYRKRVPSDNAAGLAFHPSRRKACVPPPLRAGVVMCCTAVITLDS
jgi:hypothetical protein